MIVKLLLLVNLIGYAFIVSQAFFYLLAMGNAQKNLTAPAYVELRNLLDSNLMKKNRIVYYVCLLTSPAVCILTISDPSGILFITSVIACIALWIDVYVMFKGNLPLNRLIQTWSKDDYPADWRKYRDMWLRYYRKRQVAAIGGFVSLVTGIVFK